MTAFDWEDAFCLESQLEPDERIVRDADARDVAEEDRRHHRKSALGDEE